MHETAYSVAASIMRYLFVLLLAFVILSAVARSVVESRRIKSFKRVAGLSVRWVEILAPEHYRGKWFRIADNTYIGSAKDCEIPLPRTDLLDEHARVYFRRGDVLLQTRQRRFCEVNGAKPKRNTVLCDGDTLWMKDVCFACRKRRPMEEENAHEQD